LIHLPNNNYVGAVFLTQDGAPSLRPLVNREGFVPEAGFDALARILRTGIDLATRVRASAGQTRRHQRKEQRTGSGAQDPRESVRSTFTEVSAVVREARALLASGKYDEAAAAVRDIETRLGEVAEEVGQEVSLLRVVASVGTQMAAFVHEVNSLLGSSQTVEAALTSISEDADLDREAKKKLRSVLGAVSDLRRGLERQGSYLVDVVTPDARRRRSRMLLAERFDVAVRLVQHKAERRGVQIRNDIDPELKSPPMFASELTSVFANLLTNAIKAVGVDGEIRASSEADEDSIVVRVENTGAAVKLTEAERWFRPFESTTTEVDATLGQGMGLGLPITRSILADYGAEIRFVKPSHHFATAVEITFSI
jgi:signal transduction histidine kinase